MTQVARYHRVDTRTVVRAPSLPDPYSFIDFDPLDPFSRYVSRYGMDALEDESLHPVDRQILQCQRYLTASHAVRTPIEVYALWVEMYEQYGGALQRRVQPFESERWWTPTFASHLPIPTAFGVFGLRLVMVPHLIEQDLRPTNASCSLGQEYGTGRVHCFHQSGNGKMFVATNDYHVYTYPDVEKVRHSMTVDELARQATDILMQAYHC